MVTSYCFQLNAILVSLMLFSAKKIVTQGSPPGFLPEPEYQNKPAWWRVDLGQEYDVYRIVMYNVHYFLDSPG